MRSAAPALSALALTAAAPHSAERSAYVHFDWKQVSPGVWFGLSRSDDYQSGNVAIGTLAGGGSIVVDTQASEFIGREILAKAKEVGKGPVRYVINTHAHQDHIGGNEVFVRDNPQVQIIAHRNSCDDLTRKTIPRMMSRLPQQRAGLEAMVAHRRAMAETDPAAKALDHRIEGTRLYLAEAPRMKWAMPTQCLDVGEGQFKSLNVGGRHIEIRYFGRAHSTGDLLVFLPRERIALAGDLWGENTGFAFLDAGMDGRDGSVIQTPVTLKAVRKLDFTIALTGHSPISEGKAGLDRARSKGEKIVGQLEQAVNDGTTVTALLDRMALPGNPPAFVADVWRNTIINGYEEIQVRRQLGLPIPKSK